jgi:hypothetical protein
MKCHGLGVRLKVDFRSPRLPRRQAVGKQSNRRELRCIEPAKGPLRPSGGTQQKLARRNSRRACQKSSRHMMTKEPSIRSSLERNACKRNKCKGSTPVSRIMGVPWCQPSDSFKSMHTRANQRNPTAMNLQHQSTMYAIPTTTGETSRSHYQDFKCFRLNMDSGSQRQLIAPICTCRVFKHNQQVTPWTTCMIPKHHCGLQG